MVKPFIKEKNIEDSASHLDMYFWKGLRRLFMEINSLIKIIEKNCILITCKIKNFED